MDGQGARVAVFIDWQNAYRSARRAFNLDDMPNEFGNFCPYDLGRLLATGHGRENHGTLCKVEVHRGLPSSHRDPVGHGACRRQATAWERVSSVVKPRLRPLRYPPPHSDRPVQEKGIDVQIALGIVECLVADKCDVAILVSNDTDLIPVLESAARLRGTAAIETASWSGPGVRQRLRPKGLGLYHHHVTEAQFRMIERQVNYAHAEST